MVKNKLIGSASSLFGLLEMIKKKWHWSETHAVEYSENEWLVANNKGPVDGLVIKKKRNRFRLEMEQ